MLRRMSNVVFAMEKGVGCVLKKAPQMRKRPKTIVHVTNQRSDQLPKQKRSNRDIKKKIIPRAHTL